MSVQIILEYNQISKNSNNVKLITKITSFFYSFIKET